MIGMKEFRLPAISYGCNPFGSCKEVYGLHGISVFVFQPEIQHRGLFIHNFLHPLLVTIVLERDRFVENAVDILLDRGSHVVVIVSPGPFRLGVRFLLPRHIRKRNSFLKGFLLQRHI